MRQIIPGVILASAFFLPALLIGCTPEPPDQTTEPASVTAEEGEPIGRIQDTASQTPAPAPVTAGVAEPVNVVTVRVTVWDDTDRHPLPENSELWIGGVGSWWLKEATEFGGASRDLGGKSIGQQSEMFLYPDGRSGQEIRIVFAVAQGMNPQGSDRDTLHITIDDKEVTALGTPLEAATGQVEMKIPRRHD